MKILFIFFLTFFNTVCFGQYHFYEDLKYLIKTYPKGEYFANKHIYIINVKTLNYIYYLDDNNTVVGILLFSYKETQTEKNDFQKIKQYFLLNSNKVENSTFYYYEQQKGDDSLSFLWRFIDNEEYLTSYTGFLDYDPREGIFMTP